MTHLLNGYWLWLIREMIDYVNKNKIEIGFKDLGAEEYPAPPDFAVAGWVAN